MPGWRSSWDGAIADAGLQPAPPAELPRVPSTAEALASALGEAQGRRQGPGDGGPLPGGRPAQQSVFAFLPLRSYGLRFVLQADWVVPSNREAVDCDSGWNQRLRDEARRPPSAAGQSAARSRRVRQT